MKREVVVILIFVVLFPYIVPAQSPNSFRQEGIASWYGKEFDGRPTASGEIYDSSKLTAAHPTLPFGTIVVVTNKHNNKKVTLRVNDRGPFTAMRIIDVSRAAAEILDMLLTGTAPVLVESQDLALSNTVNNAITSPVVREDPVQRPALAFDPEPVKKITPPEITVQRPENINITQNTEPLPTVKSIKLIPSSINISLEKKYRLQIGSYKIASNAIVIFDKLKNIGLSPNYEHYEEQGEGDYYRVVLAGISGTELQSIGEILVVAGFTEAIIREER
jgi:rare lipoprotein A